MYLVETNFLFLEVPDLGIVLRKGVPSWVEEDDYQRSSCLQELVRIGNARATPKSRSRSQRPAKPSLRTRKRTPPKKVAPTPKAPEAVLTVAQAQELAERAAEKAVQRVLESFPTQPPTGLLEAVQGLQEALGAVPGAVSAPTVFLSPRTRGPAPEPMFIPSGIVGPSKEAELEIQSSESGGGVEDAAQALRRMKNRRE